MCYAVKVLLPALVSSGATSRSTKSLFYSQNSREQNIGHLAYFNFFSVVRRYSELVPDHGKHIHGFELLFRQPGSPSTRPILSAFGAETAATGLLRTCLTQFVPVQGSGTSK